MGLFWVISNHCARDRRKASKKKGQYFFCLLLSSLHPIWLELISLSFHVMENCGKTHPILSDRSMQLPCSVRGEIYWSSFFIYSRIQSMVPINGAFCHSTDLLPSGYTTRQSPSGCSEMSEAKLKLWSKKKHVMKCLNLKKKGSHETRHTFATKMSNGQNSCLMKASI